MGLLVDVILVPQGSEYQAVCRGLRQVKAPQPQVLAIPIGGRSVIQSLQAALQAGKIQPNSQVLVMGLCGGLTPACPVGQVVLCTQCLQSNDMGKVETQVCHAALTQDLCARLQGRAIQVIGFTSDRMIHAAVEKRQLAEQYPVAVVDMEGFAVLQVLSQAGIAVGMVRVVSDDCGGDVPKLAGAIAADGSLRPLPLALRMVQQPIAAWRLIRGSLTGLRVLQQVTAELFANAGDNYF